MSLEFRPVKEGRTVAQWVTGRFGSHLLLDENKLLTWKL